MPCDSVAVVSAKLNAKTHEELRLSEQAREALRLYIESLTKQAVTVQVYDQAIVYTSGSTTISLGTNGVQIRSYSLGRYETTQMSEKISTMADQLALASTKQRLVQTLKSKYLVSGDVSVGSARILTITL